MAEPPVVIVTSRIADDSLWAEVLNLGGYDVLAKPFREAELIWALESAWQASRRKTQQFLAMKSATANCEAQ